MTCETHGDYCATPYSCARDKADRLFTAMLENPLPEPFYTFDRAVTWVLTYWRQVGCAAVAVAFIGGVWLGVFSFLRG